MNEIELPRLRPARTRKPGAPGGRWLPLACLVLAVLAALRTRARAAEPDRSAPGHATAPASSGDDERLRQGLRQRGLLELLEHFDRRHPPSDELTRLIRRREQLLAVRDDQAVPASQRAQASADSRKILERLLAEYPADPRRFAWRRDLARELIERDAAAGVEALLFRVPSRAQEEAVAGMARQAIDTLDRLSAELEAEWKRIEALTPEEFERASASGTLKELESVDASRAYLLAWARAYLAMTLPPSDPARADLLRRVMDEVARREWTARPHEHTGLQVQSLVLTAIAGRLLAAGAEDRDSRWAAANAAIQRAVTIYSQMTPDQRRGLESWALLALIERIRLLRDRGQTGEALTAIGRAYDWVTRARPQDAAAVVAIGVVERTVAPPAPDRDRLLSLARTQPATRPLVYELLGQVARRRENLESLGALDRLGWIWVAADDPAARPAAIRLAAELAGTADPFVAAEATYMLARCHAAAGQPREAAEALLRLAGSHPAGDRADEAVREAVRLGAEAIQACVAAPPGAVVDTFVRAVRLLRERSPQDDRLPEASFSAGAALERSARWAEAAAEFAQIPATSGWAAEAALRRARCLARLFEDSRTERAAKAAIEAARQARTTCLAGGGSPTCRSGEAVLLAASIQTDPTVGEYEAALQELVGFEQQYAGCPRLLGRLWRVRIAALQALGRLSEAAAMVEHVLDADEPQAGPTMWSLLRDMQARIEELRDKGQTRSMSELAGTAADLAARLEAWLGRHPPADATSRPSATTSAAPRTPDKPEPTDRGDRAGVLDSVRLLRAMALLDAGRTDEALMLAERYGTAAPGWRFVRAERLYQAGSFREALVLFHDAWQTSEPTTPIWWRALLRNLQCHTQIGTDPHEILASIEQHRHQHPDMGGPAMRQAFDELAARNARRMPSR